MSPHVWVERPIRTTEHAEALPAGTIIRSGDLLALRVQDGGAVMIWPPTTGKCMRDVVGWTALVPVEAEEEWGLELRLRPLNPDGGPHISPARDRTHAEWMRDHNPQIATGLIASRLVTPWEDA